MSYITFDFQCAACKRIDTRMVKRDEVEAQFCGTNCDGDHPTPMNRLPAGTRTTFRFADTKLK